MRAALLSAYWLAVVMLWWPNFVALHFRPGGLGDARALSRQACTLLLISLSLTSQPSTVCGEGKQRLLWSLRKSRSCLLSVCWVCSLCLPPFTCVCPRCCLQGIKLSWETGSFPGFILGVVGGQQTVTCGPSPVLYVSGAKNAFYTLKH